MATSTLADQALTGNWVDLTVALATMASVAAEVQNVGPGAVAIVSGGVAAPVGMSGTVLGPRDRTTVNAAHVWARSLDADGSVSVTLQ